MTEMGKHREFIPQLLDIIVPIEKRSDGKKKPNHLILVMEYIEQDLSYLIEYAKKGTITEQHVITIMYNILCAVNYVHSANVAHRDLKPANILINDQCNIRLCDLGLARTMPWKSKSSSKKEEKVLATSHSHVASRDVSPSMDLPYSLE